MRRLSLLIELRFGKEEKDEEGPQGTESTIFHQEQPRYSGFVRDDERWEEVDKR